MKVFITGISGLIGSELARQLVAKGVTVSGLTRNIDSAARKLPRAVSLVDAFENANDFIPDVVVNLAGEPIADKRWSKHRKARLRSSRIDLTQQLVDWLKGLEQMPEALISGSAVGFYGKHGDEELDEQGRIHDEFAHELCRDWEQAALKAESFTRVCIVRTGLVIARKGGFLEKMRLPFKLGLGGKIGHGQQYMSWIHLHDMVQGLIGLIENDKARGIYNFTAPNPVTNEVFSNTLAAQFNKPAWFTVPAFGLKLALGEMSELLTTGQRVIPKRLVQDGFSFRFETVEQALEDAIQSDA